MRFMIGLVGGICIGVALTTAFTFSVCKAFLEDD